MIDQTVSHYRIVEKVGEGGMGVVYKAEDTKLRRTIALKFLPPDLAKDPEAKERFVYEAQAASALDHPNICTIHEIDEAEGSTFIAMAFIEGQNLKEKISSGPLELDEILDIAIQTAEGLREAHEKGIIHRDIKSGNVMVTGRRQVKIMDFGLAKSVGRATVTRPGTAMGTAAYMSPEQVRGDEVDHCTDIWSMGVVLYEMITGRLPFRADHDQAVMYSILNQDPERVTTLRDNVPDELEEMVHKCLEKAPTDRYQTVAELASDLHNLRRAITGEVTPAPAGVAIPLRRRYLVTGLTLVAVLAAGISLRHLVFREGPPGVERKMLVVLPFKNLGPPEDEYFAAGVTEELMARLASIQGLGVIARSSAIQYKDTDKATEQIAEELGVEYVLEGSIRWQRTPDRQTLVRVTPQLIRAADATQVWAVVYQEDMTDIFQVQSDIAEQVAWALDIALLEPERQALEVEPTENFAAYRAYLRGLELYRSPTDIFEDKYQLAIQLFERAGELDPNFAHPFAAAAEAHSFLYYAGFDRTEERKSRAKAAVDRALDLQPGLPEAHLALGYYHYWCNRDYSQALSEFAIAEKGLPNDTEIAEAVFYVLRRQGRYDEAIDKLEKAFKLSPRDSELAGNLAYSYTVMRGYAEAERYCRKSIALTPDAVSDYIGKAMIHVLWRGDTRKAGATLNEIPLEVEGEPYMIWFRLWLDTLERDYKTALGRIPTVSVDYYEDHSRVVPWAQMKGMVNYFKGEKEIAQASFDASRALLEKKEGEAPDDFRLHGSLGIAYAGLGRKEDAVRQGKLGVELLPMSKDAVIGPDRIEELALIYTMVGEYDAALDQLEYLLSIPCLFSTELLRLDPRWDPLRDRPRFKRLLQG